MLASTKNCGFKWFFILSMQLYIIIINLNNENSNNFLQTMHEYSCTNISSFAY
jgi:hypothetical protein